MFYRILTYFETPSLYKENKGAFWDEDYISKQMLKAHLDPDFDGASRKLEFIEASALWIKHMLPPHRYPCLLDLGCGPGLYAERFARSGYFVTGVDVSRRSIDYANASAEKNGLDIRYLRQNYLSLETDGDFDLVTMIYCDYGALSDENRRVVLQNIYKSLKPGGRLFLDVFSMAKYDSYQEQQSWEMQKHGGFWREGEYLEINKFCKYSSNVTLDQYILVTSRDAAVYYLWNTYFSKESLEKEAGEAGFRLVGIYGDAAGSPFQEKSPMMAVILEK